ncbi:hypothetical protein BUB20358_04766 [Burkholderia ubonensis]|nr:hypothetical protein BUB20358_04766 [Burkholderia ubonensis]
MKAALGSVYIRNAHALPRERPLARRATPRILDYRQGAQHGERPFSWQPQIEKTIPEECPKSPVWRRRSSLVWHGQTALLTSCPTSDFGHSHVRSVCKQTLATAVQQHNAHAHECAARNAGDKKFRKVAPRGRHTAATPPPSAARNHPRAVISPTRCASASAAVNPGDSMPNRFTRPRTPCCATPCTMKSAGASPGPASFGRTPA